MLVSPTQNSDVGGLSQRQGPTQLFCIAVEYRLNSFLYFFLSKTLFYSCVVLFALDYNQENGLAQSVFFLLYKFIHNWSIETGEIKANIHYCLGIMVWDHHLGTS